MSKLSAFTLIELIIGITISMLLMTSVGILVSGGLSNVFKQQSIIQNTSIQAQSIEDFYHGFNNVQSHSGFISTLPQSALFKTSQHMNSGGFSYFGLINKTDEYCSLDSDFSNQDYLVLKTFIPHEEIGEDIMSDYNTINRQEVSSGGVLYSVDTLNHQVFEDNTLILGGKSFGHEFEQGADGIDIKLNNPTGITIGEGGFFLSDTLNHRILFYKDGTVSLILDKTDGLKEPTGLTYHETTSTLYIANSGKGEILSLSSQVYGENPNPSITFLPKEDINNFTNFTLTIPETSETLSLASGTGSFKFQGGSINQYEDYLEIDTNTLHYYFTNYPDITTIHDNISMPGCTETINISLNNNIPEKEERVCSDSNTGSLYLHNGLTPQSLNSSLDYQINIDEISPYLSGAQTYTMELEFFDVNTSLYKERFPYFTQGDGLVSNRENLTFSIFTDNLSYPTGLQISGNNLIVNDFIERKEYTYNIETKNRSEISLEPFSAVGFAQFPISKLTDTFLTNPISELILNYDIPNKYFTASIKYYQYFNCYNDDDNIEKTFLFHKNLKKK
ncbi:MAG: hypothetical protein GY828_06550 [Candidatus Gracilibacteria bacterium]|nr:hypothetical protein [Candidatus Gracilibacteria bacterium]